MHFKIILDDSSAGDLTAAYHITQGDSDKFLSKVNTTSEIQNMNIWHSIFAIFEHHEVFILVVTIAEGAGCCFQPLHFSILDGVLL